MNTKKLAEAKAEAARIATTDKRIKLPIWAWAAIAVALLAVGAWVFG